MNRVFSSNFDHQPVILASRASELAVRQARIVAQKLGTTPHKFITISTKGDEVLDQPLAEIGGKGLFVKALEAAIIKGEADVAIHSMKDMETSLAVGTKIAAVLPRADRRDALVGQYDCLNALPIEAEIGTASVRRAALLQHHRPDLKIKLLRGNLGTRLARLKAGEFDAIVLAVAGLQRLAIKTPYHILDETIMPPAPTQGVLAVQSADNGERADKITTLFTPLNCPDTADCVVAERALLAELDGSCRTPIAAMADLLDGGQLKLYGMILSSDGQQHFAREIVGAREEAQILGKKLAEQLLQDCGGRGFLQL